MIWFGLAFFITLICAGKDAKDNAYKDKSKFIKDTCLFLLTMLLGAVLFNIMSMAILSETHKDTGVNIKVDYDYKIAQLNDKEWINWNSDGSLVCLLETGDIATYEIDKTTKVKFIDTEEPSVKKISYGAYTDYRKLFTLFPVWQSETIITIPKSYFRITTEPGS